MQELVKKEMLERMREMCSVPRDPARIDKLLALCGEVWKAQSDLRLGQLLCNLLPYDGMLFYLEDSVLADLLLAEKYRIEAERANGSIAHAISALQKEGFSDEKIATLLNLSVETHCTPADTCADEGQATDKR